MLNSPTILSVMKALNEESIPFMVVGSLSSNVYGVPRSTHDADFVVELAGRSLMGIQKHLPEGFKLDPQIRFESVTATKRNLIYIENDTFTIELFRLSNDAHDQERFRRRVAVEVEGCRAYLPRAEDVVITKLRWNGYLNRTKDFADIVQVLRIQRDKLDWDYLNHWAAIHGTTAVLADAQKAADSA